MKYKRRNNKINIDFFELTEDEINEFKKMGRKHLKKSIIFSSIMFLFFIVLPYLIISEMPLIWLIAGAAFFYAPSYIHYFIYFFFKPIGIRYGKISKKKSHCFKGNYTYTYNVFFEDIHKSLIDVNVEPSNGVKVIELKDKVKVIKTRFGLLRIYDYKD